ncbi:MAG: sigma 54-interacting transcriptional regulator [Thermovenabulum sp.]|uniref:sigma 54-interacting transcriptional regulator n=1 Tax=Thermovenabulum sp. TaxID=3100335 RepID=UPI003C7E735A
MKERLIELIKSENKKNPYTDEQLANMLGIRRDEVTVLRSELNIPDSRERRKPYLLNEVKEILSKNKQISNRELTRIIRDRGYDVSRFLISRIRQEIDGDVKKEKDNKEFFNNSNKKPVEKIILGFERIIGHDGSLKPQIEQAKAAVLYPPHGLHTLILGETGVGKTSLAEAMYQYAVQVGKLPKNAPFVVFNCADYAENPQLLLSQLFGHVKGAYTGADSPKEGLVEKANGGILFLDEVHRLPPEGQEILYYLIDKGKFRRLGETESTRKAEVMIIAATTEDVESNLLLTFRRRIPMVIELPPLNARPITERYEIIKDFFKKEADKIGIKIKVKKEALRALLMYECPGNIGQLRSDIQVSCARGFLTYMGNQIDFIEIDLIDLPVHARRGLLKVTNRAPEIENIVSKDLLIFPGESENAVGNKDDLYVFPEEIYEYIEEKYRELKKEGLSQDVINRVIGGELEVKFQEILRQFETRQKTFEKQELAEIVGDEVARLSEKMIKIAERKLGKVDNYLFYCLSIHLAATLERIKKGKPIINPQLDKIKKEYRLEYKIAKEMAHIVRNEIDIELPEDEIGFIAMYLRTITHPHYNVKNGRVGVVVLTHGHVAKGMAEVANKLLGVEHAVGIEMSLDEKPEAVLERALEVVKKIDEGKGVILLVDMGSLVTFGEIITKRTGIPTRTIGRVDTIMVLEAVRKAIIPDTTLEEIADSLDKSDISFGRIFLKNPLENKIKTIVTLCLTGEGAALRMKKLIEKKMESYGEIYEIIPLGLTQEEDAKDRIIKLKKTKNIAAIVGTIDPKVPGVPFISIEEILDGGAFKKIGDYLGIKGVEEAEGSDEKVYQDFLEEDLILINPDFRTKEDVIEGLYELLFEKKYVKERFLFDLYKREVMGKTLLASKAAIPHGLPENVILPKIAIAVLKEPIEWENGNYADFVFMLALKEGNKEQFLKLYNVIKDRELLLKLKSYNDSQSIKNVLLELLIL